jgi:hypothetical protein
VAGFKYEQSWENKQQKTNDSHAAGNFEKFAGKITTLSVMAILSGNSIILKIQALLIKSQLINKFLRYLLVLIHHYVSQLSVFFYFCQA